jgi:hypothetical protein
MMSFRAVVVAGASALLEDTRVADFTAVGTPIGEVLIFVSGFIEPIGTKLSLFFCGSFS